MTLSHDPLWPRAGGWPAPNGPADVALVGVPTHATSLSATNAQLTPAAVRDALRRYSIQSSLSIVDAGDTLDTGTLAGIEARLLVALGGDNSATMPIDEPHDLRDGHSNGSPVRELIEAGLDGHRVVQVGIEPFANSAAYAQRARDLGITVITRADLERRGMADAMAEALEIASSGGGPVHVDLDVDVCDRSVAPACPASVPGGISAWQLRQAAAAAGAHPSVTSVDLVEVDAAADTPDGRTVRLVALCVLEIIGARS